MCVLIFSTTFVWNISHFKKKWARYDKKCTSSILVVCFLLGNCTASEFYMPTFRNTLFHPNRWIGACPPMEMEQSVPKRRYIKFRRRGITQKKTHNIQNTAKVWNQEYPPFLSDFNENLNFLSTDFRKILKYHVSWICPVGAVVSCRRTERHDEA